MQIAGIRRLESEEDLERLRAGDIVEAQLRDAPFHGYLYFTGYATEPFTWRHQLQFFGICDRERLVYYISPDKLSVTDGIITQKSRLSQMLIGGDLNIFPAGVSNAKIFQDAYDAITSLKGVSL